MYPFYGNSPETIVLELVQNRMFSKQSCFIMFIFLFIYCQIPSHKAMLNIQMHLVRIKSAVLFCSV